MKLLSFNTEERTFLFFVLIPIIGVLVTVCLSIVLSAVESIIAALLYATFSRKKQRFAASTFWNLCFVAVLTLIMLNLPIDKSRGFRTILMRTSRGSFRAQQEEC